MMSIELLTIYARSVPSPRRIAQAEAFREVVAGIINGCTLAANGNDVAYARGKSAPIKCNFPAFILEKSGIAPKLWPVVGSLRVEWALRRGTILSSIALGAVAESECTIDNLDWSQCVAAPGTLFCARANDKIHTVSPHSTAQKLLEWESNVGSEQLDSSLDIVKIVGANMSKARERITEAQQHTSGPFRSGTPTAVLGVFRLDKTRSGGGTHVQLMRQPSIREGLPLTAVMAGNITLEVGSRDRLIKTFEHMCSHLWLLHYAETQLHKLRAQAAETGSDQIQQKKIQQKKMKLLSEFVLECRPIWAYGLGDGLIQEILDEFAIRNCLHARWQQLAVDALLLQHIKST